MSDVIISVQGLGKKYRIQHQAEGRRYVALRDVIAQKLKAPFKFLRRSQKSEVGPLISDLRPLPPARSPTSDLRPLGSPPKTSGPCATFPSRLSMGKWWASSAAMARARARC